MITGADTLHCLYQGFNTAVTAEDFTELPLCFEIFIFSLPVIVKMNAGTLGEDENKLKSSGHTIFLRRKPQE